jgi:hypothetical protein
MAPSSKPNVGAPRGSWAGPHQAQRDGAEERALRATRRQLNADARDMFDHAGGDRGSPERHWPRVREDSCRGCAPTFCALPHSPSGPAGPVPRSEVPATESASPRPRRPTAAANPGHTRPGLPDDSFAIDWTRGYIRGFARMAKIAKPSREMAAMIHALHPNAVNFPGTEF